MTNTASNPAPEIIVVEDAADAVKCDGGRRCVGASFGVV